MSEQGAVVTEGLCAERIRRLEDRIDNVEEITNEIHSLSLSVERLATTVESMLSRLSEQETRLKKMELKDADMWQQIVKYSITAGIGVLIGFMFKQLGIF